MKRYIGFTLALVLSVLVTSAQNVEQNVNSKKVSKGYYAIGDNNTRLPAPSEPSVGTAETPEVNKGYYGLKQNRAKLRSKPVKVNTAAVPVVTKGYYSIGDNAVKLQNSRQR